jgi:hypothetical protein
MMTHRRIVALGTVAIAAVLAFTAFAFFSMGTTRTASAETHGIQNLHCSVAPSPVALNTPEVLTCTFTFNGASHTFVADFEISTTTPPLGLQVSSCTLDSNAVHIGPCP